MRARKHPDGFSHGEDGAPHLVDARCDRKISKISKINRARLCSTPAPASAGAAWDSRTIGARGTRAGARGVTVQPRTRKKNGATATPNEGLSRWPVAVRPLRTWCAPGIRRWCSWRVWSAKAHHLPGNGSWTGCGRGEASRAPGAPNDCENAWPPITCVCPAHCAGYSSPFAVNNLRFRSSRRPLWGMPRSDVSALGRACGQCARQ